MFHKSHNFFYFIQVRACTSGTLTHAFTRIQDDVVHHFKVVDDWVGGDQMSGLISRKLDHHTLVRRLADRHRGLRITIYELFRL